MKPLDVYSVSVGLFGMAVGIADLINGRTDWGLFLIALGVFNFFLGVHNSANRNPKA